MARTIRFHLDEHVAPAVADGLKRRGIDVTTTVAVGLRTKDDTDHVAFAQGEARVIVTNDTDFLRLHDQGVQHAGLAYYQQSQSIGDIIRGLELIWELLEPAEMRNRVEFL
jgi:hypothetical protein